MTGDGRTRPQATAAALGVAAALAALTSPATALALCPNCLGQRTTLPPGLALVGLFLLVPFVVFFAVLRVVRGAAGADRASASPISTGGAGAPAGGPGPASSR